LLVTSPFERFFGIVSPSVFAPIFIDGRRR
jgi:hypothetical protein